MDRRFFLQVTGLSLSIPSLLVEEKDSPNKRQNPDFISTGFPTIDDALGGGFRMGTINAIHGSHTFQTYSMSLLLKSIAIKAAINTYQRPSVLLITSKKLFHSKEFAPFDGLLNISNSLDWGSLSLYDLVVIDQSNGFFETRTDFKQQVSFESIVAQKNNQVIVRNNLSGYAFGYSTILKFVNHEINMTMRPPELTLFKNRLGHCGTCIKLHRPSIHFYEELK